MAVIARMMQNLPAEPSNLQVAGVSQPRVLMMEAARNPRMNQGKIFVMLKALPTAAFCRDTNNAKTNVMGTIINVRVSFTMVA